MTQSNKKENIIPYILLPFVSIIVAIIMQYIVVLIDLAILTLIKLNRGDTIDPNLSFMENLSIDYNQPMNQAAALCGRYALYIIIYGIWMYHLRNNKKNTLPELVASHTRSFFTKLSPIFIVIAAVASQFFVDSVLSLCRNGFPKLFADYDKLIDNVTGASASWLMYITVFLVAPIAEELLFRGIILNYSKKWLITPIAIFFQAILFGVYHGNLIQGVYAFALGSLLGFITYKFNSLIPAILFHIVTNSSILLVSDSFFDKTSVTIGILAGTCVVIVVTMIFAVKSRNWKLKRLNKSDASEKK